MSKGTISQTRRVSRWTGWALTQCWVARNETQRCKITITQGHKHTDIKTQIQRQYHRNTHAWTIDMIMTKQDKSLYQTQTLELNSNSLIGCLEEERGGCEQFAWAFTQHPSYQLETSFFPFV